jgi:hypothetical protein
MEDKQSGRHPARGCTDAAQKRTARARHEYDAVQLRITDFNAADTVFSTNHRAEWDEIAVSVSETTLHLKASDQASKVGAPIWDAVGTNAALKQRLVDRHWSANVPIPEPYKFLGTDFDFLKTGVLVEVQFSNYPFLLNNLLRSELFYKGKLALAASVVEAAVIVTKTKMFDASNSTLYYEQAQRQLVALADNGVFDVPLRLVGLFEDYGAVPVVWTVYSAARYSRTISTRRDTTADISPGARASSRAAISIR